MRTIPYRGTFLVSKKAYNIVCCKLLHTEREALGDIPDLRMHRILHWAAVIQPLAMLCSRKCRYPLLCLLERILHEHIPCTNDQNDSVTAVDPIQPC
jgi:hypothetical protein